MPRVKFSRLIFPDKKQLRPDLGMFLFPEKVKSNDWLRSVFPLPQKNRKLRLNGGNNRKGLIESDKKPQNENRSEG